MEAHEGIRVSLRCVLTVVTNEVAILCRGHVHRRGQSVQALSTVYVPYLHTTCMWGRGRGRGGAEEGEERGGEGREGVVRGGEERREGERARGGGHEKRGTQIPIPVTFTNRC